LGVNVFAFMAAKISLELLYEPLAYFLYLSPDPLTYTVSATVAPATKPHVIYLSVDVITLQLRPPTVTLTLLASDENPTPFIVKICPLRPPVFAESPVIRGTT